MSAVDQLVVQFSNAVNVIDANTKALQEILVAFDELGKYVATNKTEEEVKIDRLDQVIIK